MGVYDALKEKGFRIPEDVSVVGFDNQELLPAHSRPPLTTVRIPYFEMGSWAVDQLMDAEPKQNIRRGNLRPVESRDRRFHSTTKI